MRDIFRQKVRGIFTVGIISLIAIAFAFWGLGDYFNLRTDRDVAAIVDGKKISWSSVNTFYNRVQKHFGSNVNEAALKEQLRMALVQRTALLASARALGFGIGDVQLAENLIQMPAFQDNGKFSKARYQEILQQAGYKDAEFRSELAQDLIISQLEQGLVQSNFGLKPELSRLVALIDEKRDFGYFIISAKNYQNDIKIKPEEIQAYYDAHKPDYILPEQVSLEYVKLSAEALPIPPKPSEQDLKTFYEEHAAYYTAPETVHARHILIPINMGASEEQAKEKIAALTRELEQGKDFATLAKEYSADEGSAKNGGDLGWFIRGQMVPEFEQAAFDLKKPDEISGPVRTQFGYHIIQLIAKKPQEQRSFEEMKSLVAEQYQKEKVLSLYHQKLEEMTKLAFDHSTSLTPVADALGLKIETTPLVSRKGGKPGIISRPEVIKAAFSDEVRTQSHNSQPIKLDDFSSVVVRLKERKPATLETLEQVKQRIDALLVTKGAQAKVKELGETLAKQMQEGASPKTLASQYKLTWIEKKEIARNNADANANANANANPEATNAKDANAKDARAKNAKGDQQKNATAQIDPTVLGMAFQTQHPEENRPGIESFALPSGDYAVLAVTKIHPGNIDDMDAGMRKAYNNGLAELFSQMEFSLYANQVYHSIKAEFPEPMKADAQVDAESGGVEVELAQDS